MKTLPPERVREIAAQESHNVTSTGAPGSTARNTRTIERAINRALKEERKLRGKARSH